MGSEFVEVGEIVAFDYFPDHFHVLVLIEHDLLFLCWSRFFSFFRWEREGMTCQSVGSSIIRRGVGVCPTEGRFLDSFLLIGWNVEE